MEPENKALEDTVKNYNPPEEPRKIRLENNFYLRFKSPKSEHSKKQEIKRETSFSTIDILTKNEVKNKQLVSTPGKAEVDQFFREISTNNVVPKNLESVKIHVEDLITKSSNQQKNVYKSMLIIVDELYFKKLTELPSHLRSRAEYIFKSIQYEKPVHSFSPFPGRSYDLESAKKQFEMNLSEVTAKKLLELPGIKIPSYQETKTAESLLTLLSHIDKNIDVNYGLKIAKSRTWQVFLRYISNPGHVIQTLRKFPDLVTSSKINASALKRARSTLKKSKPPGLAFLHTFLASAFSLWDSLSHVKIKRSKSCCRTPLKGLSYQPTECLKKFILDKLSNQHKLSSIFDVYKQQNAWFQEFLEQSSDSANVRDALSILNSPSEFRLLVNQIRLQILSQDKQKLIQESKAEISKYFK